MFETIYLSDFGDHLRNIRLSLGLTQVDVQNSSTITADTLRRIESGQSVPRYDTLVLLSKTYKRDLILDLKKHTSTSKLFEYYQELDQLIIKGNIAEIDNLEQEVTKDLNNDLNTDLLIQKSEATQFTLMLSGIKKYYSDSRSSSFEDFYSALEISHPGFKPTQYEHFSYTDFELRLLLLLGLSLSDALEQGTSILLYCLKSFENSSNLTTHEKFLLIKLYFNLSYNFHRSLDYKNALKYARLGIQFCNENYLSYCLAQLLYRKGIAEFRLGIDGYKTTLKLALHMQIILGNPDQAEEYKRIAYETYKIEL
ncbi:MAG: helix-turn-helix domain-containing protein [Bacteroidales bacterium]|nr:helix-turn-helix domain-containing protein [Bacteroidales bacterium]